MKLPAVEKRGGALRRTMASYVDMVDWRISRERLRKQETVRQGSGHCLRPVENHAWDRSMLSEKLETHAEEAADLLSALGNTKRFLILYHLLHEELSVGAIASVVGLSQSALSQHLAKLRALGLVNTRRDKQTIYYSCNSELVRRVLLTLDQLYSDYSRAAE